MTYAIPDDVAVQLGRPIDSITLTERAQWQAWLDKVERSIRRVFKKVGLELDEQINLGEVDVKDVVDVEVAAVIRKIDNPKSVESTTTTRSADDASISNTERRKVGTSGDPLSLLDEEIDDLLPEIQSDAFTIQLAGQPGYADESWCRS